MVTACVDEGLVGVLRKQMRKFGAWNRGDAFSTDLPKLGGYVHKHADMKKAPDRNPELFNQFLS